MSDDLHINDRLTVPGYELWFTASRSSGPGGQHANTTSSRVTLHWVPANTGALQGEDKERLISRLSGKLTSDGELQVSAQDERSQHKNRAIARDRMAEVLRAAMRKRKRRKRTRTPYWAKQRRLRNKKRVAEKKSTRKNPDPSDY
jgi:ribosome-associated protein